MDDDGPRLRRVIPRLKQHSAASGRSFQIAVIPNPTDVTALRGDDFVTESELGEPAIHHITGDLVQTTPHKKTGGRKEGTAGPPSDGVLRIATNLLDEPAEVIADIYRHRWTIELFFRFFKYVLGCRHLLSTDPAGIQIQAYLAIIACLLIHLWTGGKPTLRTYEMVCF